MVERNDLPTDDGIHADPPEQSQHGLPPLPVRPTDAHKGTFGRVLIVAGSFGMSGAASLAGRGALYGGAGLVSVAVPRSILPIVAMLHPSYMTIPLPEDEQGRVTEAAVAVIEGTWSNQSAVAIGPGLGQSDAVRTLVHQVYQRCPFPLVLDADGLNAFSGNTQQMHTHGVGAPRVLTPHVGELSRLTGYTADQIMAGREEIAIRFARDRGITLLLKGPQSIVTDGVLTWLNSTGNSGMATGGTGDVLTGLLASLLAQGMSGFDAARLAAYLHGLAGDFAARQFSEQFMTSEELLWGLSSAWKEVGQAVTRKEIDHK